MGSPVRSVPRPLCLVLVPLAALLVGRQESAPVAVPLAGDGPAAEFAFEILDPRGEPLPARLSFVPPDGSVPELFTAVDAAPQELAARRNVVYTRSGSGAITVPPGAYRVYASRGLEWSLAQESFELRAGERAHWRAELVHEIDSTGWVSGDFHLHTLTHSGHGDANLLERVLSFLGEGLEFAVATDHNHNTDYGPTVRELAAGGEVATVTGNEVTTSIGHFNAFPLEPSRTPVDASLTDANALFRLIRAESNPWGVVPVIQLNHPRWDGIDYFAQTGLDPITGTSSDPDHAPDFDALEVFNENVGWGYFDPIADRVDTSGNRHAVLADWFHLLQRGSRPAAVGNSDSHHVQETFSGWPRNFVRSASDDPAAIDPGAIAGAVRAKQLFTTLGPFVEFSVEGVPMGGEALARDGHAELRLRVQAASWIDCDRVKVVVNGEIVSTLAVPDVRTPLRLETSLFLCLRGRCDEHGHRDRSSPAARDAWVVLLVEGDDSLAPIVNDASQRALPLAVANPVWIDGDGDGAWTAPQVRIARELDALAAAPEPELRAWLEERSAEERRLALCAARPPLAGRLIARGLADAARDVRLAAARAAGRSPSAALLPGLTALWETSADDPYLAAVLLSALAPALPAEANARLFRYQERFGDAALRRYGDEFLEDLGGQRLTAWLGIGFLDPENVELAKTGAALDADPDRTWTGRDGRELAWRTLAAREETGYVDLVQLGGEGEDAGRALAFAQTWLYVPERKTVPCCFGTDDGSRVWLNDSLIYENLDRRRANPLEKVAALDLAPGWNRLLFQVQNASGTFGFYCRVLDTDVRASVRPER